MTNEQKITQKKLNLFGELKICRTFAIAKR